MRYILIILLCFSITYGQQGYDKWATYPDYLTTAEGIPTLAEVGATDGLVYDIYRQQFGRANANITLGSNIISNGDFHDFTMDNDANTVGHWVFSSGYNNAQTSFTGADVNGSAYLYNLDIGDYPTNNFEIEFETVIGDDTDNQVLFRMFGGGYVEGLRFFFNNPKQLYLQCNFGDASPVAVSSPQDIWELHELVKIRITYNGSYIRVYLNNVLVGEVAETRNINITDNHLRFGHAGLSDLVNNTFKNFKFTIDGNVICNYDFTQSLTEDLSGNNNYLLSSDATLRTWRGNYIGEDWSDGGAVYDDKITNGTFDTDTAWNKGTGVTISDGEVHFTGSTGTALWQSIGDTTTGKLYKITYEITAYTSGSIQCRIGSANPGTLRSAVGTYSEILEKIDSNFNCAFVQTAFVGSIDNVVCELLDNGNHLVANGDIENTTETEALPQFNNASAPELDGVNDYWYIPSAQAGDFNPGTGDFTIEGWVKTPSSFVDTISIIDKRVARLDSGYALYIDDSGYLSYTISEPAGNQSINVSYNSALSTSTSYYVAVSFDRSGDAILYINGSAVDTTSITTVSDAINPSVDFVVGKRAYADEKYFLNTIYEVRYSDKARTAQEIEESYGLAKGYTWNGTGSVSNSSFEQVVSGGGTVTYSTSTVAGNLYKEDIDNTIDYVNEDNYDLTFTDGTYSNIKLQKVTNASWDDGTTVTDYSGAGNHGTISGGMESTGTLIHPAALEFDGSDDYISHSDISMSSSDAWLVNTWVKVSTSDLTYFAGDNSVDEKEVGWNTDGTYNFMETDSTLNSYTADIDDNLDKYIMVSFYGYNGSVSLYINGVFSETISSLNSTMLFNAYGNARTDLTYALTGFGGSHVIYKWDSDYTNIANLVKRIYNNTNERY